VNGLWTTPRAPGRPPLVIPTMLGIFALQALCLPALPVLFIVGWMIRWRGWRPGRIALGALAVLVAEVWGFGADLARLHFAGWARLDTAHPFAVILPRLVVESPVGVPLGVLLASLILLHGEHAAAGAEWHPATRRRKARELARVGRQAGRLLARHAEDPALPQLGVLLADHGLPAWVAGRYVVVPPGLRGLGQVVVGMPGMGKTATLLRLVFLAAKQGRQVVFLDCKGTDPTLPAKVEAAYRAALPAARVRRWPAEAFDLWRGQPSEITNKLLGTQRFAREGGGIWYADLAARAVQLAVEAPGGPPHSSMEFMGRLHVQALRKLWEQADDPAQAQAALLDIGAFQDHELRGVRLKFATFFQSLRGRFDGSWAWEDCDLAVCTIPAMAKRDADAVVRALIEDLRYYLLDPQRKPREGKDVTAIVDEFSAVDGATERTIDLAERARDVGGQCVLASQTAQGLGTPEQRAQLLGACTGGVFLFRTPDPEPFLAHAGTIRVPELSWQLDAWGASGQAKAFMAERPLVDPNHVRQAPALHGWVLQAGRAVAFRVLFAPSQPEALLPAPPARAELAVRQPANDQAADAPDAEAAARWAYHTQYAAKEPAATLPRPGGGLVAEPGQPAPAGPRELPVPNQPGQPAAVTGRPLVPVNPGDRLRLALAAAVHEGNHAKAARLVALGRELAPGWDADAELARLRRHRRRWLAAAHRLVLMAGRPRP
jgi:hypothetical protein